MGWADRRHCIATCGLKRIGASRAARRSTLEAFCWYASAPRCTPAGLSCCAVGHLVTALPHNPIPGDPAGVEFAGTLSDFLREDLKKKYPELMQFVRVSLLNATPSILVQFDEG